MADYYIMLMTRRHVQMLTHRHLHEFPDMTLHSAVHLHLAALFREYEAKRKGKSIAEWYHWLSEGFDRLARCRDQDTAAKIFAAMNEFLTSRVATMRARAEFLARQELGKDTATMT